MTEDYYELLGVGRDASVEEIERAYREQAARWHPDVSDDPDAGTRFKRIQEAKEVLTDERTRRAYDRLGHERFTRREGRPGAGDASASTGGGPRTGSRRRGPFGPGSGWTGGATGFGSLFDRFFGRGREDPFRRTAGSTTGTHASRPREGGDLRTSLDVTLEEAYHGARKPVTVTRSEPCSACDGEGHTQGSGPHPCPTCNGRGHVIHIADTGLGRRRSTERCDRCGGSGELPGEPCTQCGGDGRIQRRATLDVDVPAGVETGQTLRLDHEGDLGKRGGPRGDLLADVEVGEHPEFAREGDDLYTGHPLSFPQAVFGATVEVPTLDHSLAMSVPPGTQSGETFRLRGRGMPEFGGAGRGDLYVRVQVVTPEDLTPEQREALRAFVDADASGLDGEGDLSSQIEL